MNCKPATKIQVKLCLLIMGVLLLISGCVVERHNSGATDAQGATESHFADVADCLWYSARNHGFLDLQLAAVVSNKLPTGTEHRIWLEFAGSVGRDECGFQLEQLNSVVAALGDTASSASRLLGHHVGFASPDAGKLSPDAEPVPSRPAMLAATPKP